MAETPVPTHINADGPRRTPSGRPKFASAKIPSSRYIGTSTRLYSGGSNSLRGARVTEEEADAILQGFASEDNFAKKTWSRTVVENFLQYRNWYFPRRSAPDAPSLVKSWAYYEHITLPRHFVGDRTTSTVLRRAEPGEHEQDTELYNPFTTPQSSLIEWGTGIDLYFISLRFFAGVMLICGLINIASIDFYSSSTYRGTNPLISIPTPLLEGSAVCTNASWVACTDCAPNNWNSDKQRYATGIDSSGNEQVLVLRNFCPGANLENGITNFMTLIFLLVTIGIFSVYLRLREIRFDEDKVTTTDYSICVKNPPPDALDVEEWKDFFSQFADNQVTAITIALNNEKLIQKLITRRKFWDQLRIKLPKGTDLEDPDVRRIAVDVFMREKAELEVGCIGRMLNACIFPVLRRFNMFLEPDALVEKIEVLTEEVKELQNDKYDATEVYVTFETEEGQRAALTALTTGKLNNIMNNTSVVAPGCVFHDRVLKVAEPPEPNAVRYLDLSASTINKISMRLLSLALTVGIVAVASYSISAVRSSIGPFFSGILTTIWNSIIPLVIKFFMIFEKHADEGGRQASLYLKITLFRWVLSGVLVQIITPFTSTLGTADTDLIRSISAILLSDVWLAPLLRLLDIMSNLKKHVLAPRAKTQEEMNLFFQGTFFNLGERYTDFTKVLFVVFFYSAVFPTGFFFGFLILTFQYLTDKFCLMRIWGWTPFIGSQLAEFSRRYFFSGSVIAMGLLSAYAYAQFPYDNLCVAKDPMGDFGGTYTNVTDLNNDLVSISSTALGTVAVMDPTEFVYCSQRWQDYSGFGFPPTPRLQQSSPSWRTKISDTDLTWMTSSQETLTSIYGWFTVALVLAYILTYFAKRSYTYFISIFIGMYKPEGDSQHIDFSSNPEIYAYVPQVKLVGYPFPFLACDIDDIDQGLIGWNDPARSYDYYNLIFDVPHKTLRRKTRIDENTRGAQTIAAHEEYQGNFPESIAEGDEGGVEVETNTVPRGRPIFSIIRHYPTKWQIELSKKDQ